MSGVPILLLFLSVLFVWKESAACPSMFLYSSDMPPSEDDMGR